MLDWDIRSPSIARDLDKASKYCRVRMIKNFKIRIHLQVNHDHAPGQLGIFMSLPPNIFNELGIFLVSETSCLTLLNWTIPQYNRNA